jgi:hypothetical protein
MSEAQSTKPCPYCGDPMPDSPYRATCGARKCTTQHGRIVGSGDVALLHMGGVDCVVCGKNVERHQWNQVTCGDPKCRGLYKWQTMRARPEYVQKNRDRFRRWDEDNGRKRNPWLIGQPVFAEYLPGAIVSVYGKPIPHEHIRGLHGAVSTMIGRDHEQTPGFSLVPTPTGCGWSIYTPHLDVARSLCGRVERVRLFTDYVEVTTGMATRLRTPKDLRRGHQRVRIDAVTPVVTQSHASSIGRTAPDNTTLASTINCLLARRLQPLGYDPNQLCLEVVSRDTTPANVTIGGKIGSIRGWVGSVTVDVNSVGRWFLECAALGLGLGGRTAFGFGRVRVSRVVEGA